MDDGPIEKPVLNGAELLRALAATGTSPGKLEPAGNLLAFVHRKEKRVATANEVIRVLELAGDPSGPYAGWPPTPDLTVRKARALAATGRWDGPKEAAERHVWDLVLEGAAVPEAVESPAVEAAAETFRPDVKLEDPLELKPAPRPAPKPKAKPPAAPAPAGA